MSDTQAQLQEAAELLIEGHMSAEDYDTIRQMAVDEGIQGTKSAAEN